MCSFGLFVDFILRPLFYYFFKRSPLLFFSIRISVLFLSTWSLIFYSAIRQSENTFLERVCQAVIHLFRHLENILFAFDSVIRHWESRVVGGHDPVSTNVTCEAAPANIDPSLRISSSYNGSLTPAQPLRQSSSPGWYIRPMYDKWLVRYDCLYLTCNLFPFWLT